MLYEVRRLVAERGAGPRLRAALLDQVWPTLEGAGIQPLCLLNGLIGVSAEEHLFVIGYQDSNAWQTAQPVLPLPPPELVSAQDTRLYTPSEVRPKAAIPVEDRRAVYGVRRFRTGASDWPAFVRSSASGIWPRIERQGACILGLFREASAADPLDVLLLTGYHGPAHWQDTRTTSGRPAGMPAALWQADTAARTERGGLTLDSYVALMTAWWPAPG